MKVAASRTARIHREHSVGRLKPRCCPKACGSQRPVFVRRAGETGGAVDSSLSSTEETKGNTFPEQEEGVVFIDDADEPPEKKYSESMKSKMRENTLALA